MLDLSAFEEAIGGVPFEVLEPAAGPSCPTTKGENTKVIDKPAPGQRVVEQIIAGQAVQLDFNKKDLQSSETVGDDFVMTFKDGGIVVLQGFLSAVGQNPSATPIAFENCNLLKIESAAGPVPKLEPAAGPQPASPENSGAGFGAFDSGGIGPGIGHAGPLGNEEPLFGLPFEIREPFDFPRGGPPGGGGLGLGGNGIGLVREVALNGIGTQPALPSEFAAGVMAVTFGGAGPRALNPVTFQDPTLPGNLTIIHNPVVPTLFSNGSPVMFRLASDTVIFGETAPGLENVLKVELTNVPPGAFEVTLLGPIDHIDGNATDLADICRLLFDVNVIDADGNQAEGVLEVGIADDAPVVGPDTNFVTEQGLVPNGTQAGNAAFPTVVNDSVAINFGADGPRQGIPAVEVNGFTFTDPETGTVIDPATLTSGGQNLLFASVGTNLVATTTGGDPVFSFSIGNTGNYNFTLSRQLDHPDLGEIGADDPIRVTFDISAHDFDGDSTASTVAIDIRDDGPLAAASNVQVEEAALAVGSNPASPNEVANGVVGINFGADGPTTAGNPFAWGTTVTVTDPDDGNVVVPLTSGGVPVTFTVSADGQTLTGAAGGTNVIQIQLNDINTGAYTVTLLGPVDHPDLNQTGAADPLLLNIPYTLTDFDGDTATNSANVTILDDAPAALNDMDMVVEGQITTGNVVTGVDTDVDPRNVGVLQADSANADGFDSQPPIGIVTNVQFGATNFPVPAAGSSAPIATPFGILTMNSDGSYSFDATGVAVNGTQQVTFTYTIVDDDGDTATADLVIDIKDDVFRDMDMVEEAALNADGTNPASPNEVATGTLSYTFANGTPNAVNPFDFTLPPTFGEMDGFPNGFVGPLTSDGVPIVFTLSPDGQTVTGTAGATPIITISVTNATTGAYTVTLFEEIDHPDPTQTGANDQIVINLNYTITDSAGTTNQGVFEVGVKDDGPIFVQGTDMVEEAALADGSNPASPNETAAGLLGYQFGADGPTNNAGERPFVWSNTVTFGEMDGFPNGFVGPLTSNGVPVTFTVSADGLTLTGSAGATPVIIIQNTNVATGAYTITLLEEVDHPDPAQTGANDQITLNLSYTLLDDDGDTTVGTFVAGIKDDGPTATAATDMVDERDLPFGSNPGGTGETTSGNLPGFTFGADGPTDNAGQNPFTWSPTVTFGEMDAFPNGFVGPLTSGGVPVVFTVSADGLTLTGTAGVTPVITVQITNVATGAYTATLLQPIDHPDPARTGADDQILLNLQYQLLDDDGDTFSGAFALGVKDDGPIARDDMDMVVEGTITTGNVVTGVDTDVDPRNVGVLQADSANADGFESNPPPGIVTQIQFGANPPVAVAPGAPGIIDTGNGIMTMNSDGSYSFDATGITTNGNQLLQFTYTIIDDDGDTDTAMLDLTLKDDVFRDMDMVDERALDGRGSLEGDPIIGNNEVATGNLSYVFPNGTPAAVNPFVWSNVVTFGEMDGFPQGYTGPLTADGDTVVFTVSPDGLTLTGSVPLAGTGQYAGQDIITVQITDVATGAYTATLLNPVDHPDGGHIGPDDQIVLNLGYTITDSAANSVQGIFELGVKDDGPQRSPDVDMVDERALDGIGSLAGDPIIGDNEVTMGNLTYSFGSDTPAAVDPFRWSPTPLFGEMDGFPNGFTGPLTSNGVPITFAVSPDGLTLTGSAGATTIITVQLTDVLTGAYTVTLSGVVDHPDPTQTGVNDQVSLILNYTTTDNDGDTSTGSFVVGIKDDGPTARDDMDMVLENTITTGNVVTAVDTDVDPRNQGMLLADSSGADGFDAGGAIVTMVQFGANPPVAVTPGVPGVIDTGGLGILTINADGSYSFDTTGVNVANDTNVRFTYTIQDREGDTDTAELKILVKDGDNNNFRDMDMVDERALDGRGSLENDPVIGNNEVTTGNLSYTFANGTPNAVNPFVFSNVITFGESDAFPNGFAGPVTAGGDTVVFTVSADGQTITGSVPAGTGPFVGQDIITIQVTDPSTGAYTVTLINPIDHPDPTQTGVQDQIALNLSYTVTDSAGTTGNGTFVVSVKDDGPFARDDMDMAVEGAITTGNVVTGVDTDIDPRQQGMLQADSAGADGFDPNAPIGIVTNVNFNGTDFAIPDGGNSGPINTPFGILTMNADGSYSFDSTGVNVSNSQNVSFTYTIRDAEGDLSTANLDILIKDNLFRDMDMVQEDALNANGTNPASPNEIATGNLNYTYGSDGPTNNPGERPFVWQTPVTFGEMDGFPNGFTGPITADGDLVVFTVSADGQTITGSVPAGTGQYVGQDIITIQVTDFNTGAYVVTLINPVDHPDPNQTGANDQIVLNLNYELTDDDGDTSQGIFEVGIKDDAPVARDDMDMVVENQITTGNVITAVDPDVDPRNVGVLVADDTGSDTPTLVTNVNFNGTDFGVPAGGSSAPINTPFGILVMNSDGSYTFDATGIVVNGTQQVTFRYTITDDDGDTSAANLVIDIKDDVFRDMDMVDERALDTNRNGTTFPGGSLENDPVIGGNEIATGNLSYVFANGTPAAVNPFVFSPVITFGEMDGFPNGFVGPVTADGDTVVFTVSPDGLTVTGSVPNTGTGQYAGQDIIQIQVTDVPTGAYTVTLFNPIDHPDGTQAGPDDQIVLNLEYTITDSAGTQNTGTFEVGVKDDGPIARRDMDMVDERALDGRGSLEFDPVIGGNEVAMGNLTYSFASGAPAAGTDGFTWLPNVAFGEADGFPNGFTGPITAGGDAVVFTVSADGLTMTGAVPAGVGPFAGQDIITIQITDIATGAYTITLVNPIDHPDPNQTGVNDQIELVLSYQITDSDGDTASSQFAVGVKDDGPFARDDMDMVAEGQVTTGNVVTGVDTDANPLNQGMLQADSSGSDGFKGAGGMANVVTEITFGAITAAVSPGTPGVIDTGTGILTMNADGSYTFDSTGVNVVGDQNLMFTYTIMDAEGDMSTANLDILVKDNNPPVFDDMDMVDERALDGRGTLEFDPIIGDNEVAMGNLSYVFANGTPNAAMPFMFTGIAFSEMDGFPNGFAGPITADGDTVVFTISADGQTLTGAVPAGTGSFVGQDIITIQITDVNTGAYTVTLINPIDHPDPARAGANDQIELNITYTVTDSAGTQSFGTFDVGIKDDEPIARDDMDMVVEGQITTGNVITAVDTDVDPRNQGMLAADTIGADGEGQVVQIEFSDPNFGAFASQVLPGTPGSVPTPFGILTMNSDGSYSFDATGVDVDQSQTVTIRYTIRDNDGDETTANLKIEIKDSRFNDMDMVEEAALDANGTNPASPNEIANGNLNYSFGADGPANDPGERPFVWSPTVTFGEMDGFPNGFVGPLTSNGVPVTFTVSADGQTLTGSAGATPIITIQLTDVDTGAYTVTLLGPVDHPDPNQTFANDQVVLELSYTLTDEDGDTGFGKFDVGIKDDAPFGGEQMDMVDERGLDGRGSLELDPVIGDDEVTTGNLNLNFGADGPTNNAGERPFVWSNIVTVTDPDDGFVVVPLTADGDPVVFTVSADGQTITGSVPAGAGQYVGQDIIRIEVTDINTGAYTVTLLNPVDHPDIDESGALDALRLDLSYTLTDDDGDTGIGVFAVDIKDDAPIARDDMDMVVEGQTTTGNVITAVDNDVDPRNQGMQVADTEGSDQPALITGIKLGTNPGDPFINVPNGGSAGPIPTPFGALTINSDGSYSFNAAGVDVNAPQDVIFTYRLTDDDGDNDTAELKITIKDNVFRDMDMVDERGLDGRGSLENDPVIGDDEIAIGNLSYVFPNGTPNGANPFVWDTTVTFGEMDGFPQGYTGPLQSDGDDVVFAVSPDGLTLTGSVPNTGTGQYAGQDIIIIQITDVATGAYQITLVNPVDHPDPLRSGADDQIELLLNYTITDSAGQTANGIFEVGVKDDGPTARRDMDMVDERALDGIGTLAGDAVIGDNEVTMGNLGYSFTSGGPAGVNAFVWDAAVGFGEVDGFPQGFVGPLTADGDEVTFLVSLDGQTITGIADPGGTGAFAGQDIIRIEITDVLAGAYTVTLLNPVDHPDPARTGVLDQLELLLTYTITDSDGDQATGAFAVGIKDDGPFARSDMDMVVEDQMTTGNVITAVDTDVDPRNQGMLMADSSGSDGFDPSLGIVTGIKLGTNPGDPFIAVPAGGSAGPIATAFGTLTIDSNGNYTFDATGVDVAVNQMVIFTYQIQDAEGDTSETTLEILIKDDDNDNFRDVDMVDERALDGRGSLENDPVIGTNEIATGTLSYNFANGTPNAVNPFVFSPVVSFGEMDGFPNGFVGPITADGDTVQFTVSPDGQTITGSVPNTGTGEFAGQDIITIEITDVLTGAYTVTLLNPIDHPDPTQTGADDQLTLNLSYTVTDSAGTQGNGTFVVGVKDDGPFARDDMDMAVEGMITTGNVVTGVDTDADPRQQGMLQMDSSGADGYDDTAPIGIVTNVNFNGTDFAIPEGGNSGPIATPFGILIMNADGSYTFDSTGIDVDQSQMVSFRYTIRDEEGDLSSANLDIEIKDSRFNDMDMVDERALDAAGTNPGSNDEITTGNLNYSFGADGPTTDPAENPFQWSLFIGFGEMDGFPNGFTGPLTADGDEVVFTVSADGLTLTGSVPNTGTGQYAGQDIITIVLNDINTGAYTVTLLNPVDHPDPDQSGADDQIVLDLQYRLLDEDGDTAFGTFEVGIKDDAPIARDDMDMVVEGQQTTGNVIDGTDTDPNPMNQGMQVADDTGSDVPTLVTGIKLGTNPGDPFINVPNGGSAGPINTPFGMLTINSDGSYTFDASGVDVNAPQDVVFTYQITDDDGDQSTAELKITVKDQQFMDMDMVDERALDTVGSNPGSDDEITTGNLSYTFVSGTPAAVNPFVFDLNVTFGEMDGFPNGYTGPLQSDGDTLEFRLEDGGQTIVGFVPNTGTGEFAGQDIIRIEITDVATGAYQVTLLNPVDHPDPTQTGADDQIVLNLNYTVTDDNGATGNGTFEVGVKDDGPTARNDKDMTFRGGTTTGNVITGADNDVDPINQGMQVADTEGADGVEVIREIMVDGVTYTLNATNDGIDVTGVPPVAPVFNAATGELTIETAAGGTFTIDMSGANVGDYSYTAPAGGGGGAPFTLDLTDPGVVGTPGITIEAFDIDNSMGTLSFDGNGMGVINDPTASPADNGNAAVPNQLNHAPDAGTSERIEITLDAGATEFSFAYNRAIQGESGGEVGQWTAFDAGGNQIGQGLFGNPFTPTAGAGVGSVDVTSADLGGMVAAKVVFTALPYFDGDQGNNDSSDYYLTEFSATPPDSGPNPVECIKYTIEDEDGDRSSAELKINVKDGPFVDMDMVDERALDAMGSNPGSPDEITQGNLSYVFSSGLPAADFMWDATTITFGEMDGFPNGFTGPITADGDEVEYRLENGGDTLVGFVPNTGTGEFAGQDMFTVELTDIQTGAYTVTLLNPVDHPDPTQTGADDQIVLNLNYLVTDTDGNQAFGTFEVGIKDDGPTARDDMDMTTKGGKTTGNVITGVDNDPDPIDQGVFGVDTEGADGVEIIRSIEHEGVTFTLNAAGDDVDITGVPAGAVNFNAATGELTFETEAGGTFTIDMSGPNVGDYTYMAPPAAAGITYGFDTDGFGFPGPWTGDNSFTFNAGGSPADDITVTAIDQDGSGFTPFLTSFDAGGARGLGIESNNNSSDKAFRREAFEIDLATPADSVTLEIADMPASDSRQLRWTVRGEDANGDPVEFQGNFMGTGVGQEAVSFTIDQNELNTTEVQPGAFVGPVTISQIILDSPANAVAGFGDIFNESSFVLNSVTAHAPGDCPDNEMFTYTIEDEDGDQSSAKLTVKLKDDPNNVPMGGDDMDMVDERGLDGIGSEEFDPVLGDNEVTTGNLSYDFGPDGPAGVDPFVWSTNVTFGEMDGFPNGYSGPLQSDGDTLEFRLEDGGLTLIGFVPNTGTGEFAGEDIIRIELNDVNSAAYTVTLLNPVDHPDPDQTGADDQIVLNLEYTITDGTGDQATGSFEVGIKDDGPWAEDDIDMTTKGGTTTGNVVTGVDNDPDPINQGMQEADIPGADGAEVLRSITHEGVTFTLNATNDDVDVTSGTPAGAFNFDPGTGELTFETEAGGSFTIDMTGNNLGDYSYTAPGGGSGGVMYSFDSDDFGFPGPWTGDNSFTFNSGGDPADDITVTALDLDSSGFTPFLTSFNANGARGLGIESNNNSSDKAFRREAFRIDFETAADSVVLEIADMPASDSRQLRWTAVGKDANGDDVVFQGNFEGTGMGQEAVTYVIDQNELNTTEVQPGSFTGPIAIERVFLDSPADAVSGFGDIFNETSFVLNSVKTTTPGDMPDMEMFTYVLEDGDGDQEAAKLTIKIKDDPDRGDPKGGHVCEMINEKHLDDGSSPNAAQTMRAGSLEYDFGPDGPAASGAFEWSNMVVVSDSDDGDPQPFSGTATVNGVPIDYDVSADGLTINGMAGGTLVFTLEVTDLASGQYKYTQFEAIDHPDPTEFGVDDTLVFDFEYTITDADGEMADGKFQMIVKDDSPWAEDDWDMVRVAKGPTTGNVVSGEDNDADPVNQGMQVEDTQGADRATVTSVRHDGVDYIIPPNGSVTFMTELGGEMTFNSDGSYSYTPPDDIPHRGSGSGSKGTGSKGTGSKGTGSKGSGSSKHWGSGSSSGSGKWGSGSGSGKWGSGSGTGSKGSGSRGSGSKGSGSRGSGSKGTGGSGKSAFEEFEYTLTDTDGDRSVATLDIEIKPDGTGTGTGSKGTGSKGTGSKGTGSKGTGSKGTGSRGSKGTGSKGSGSKGSGSKGSGSRGSMGTGSKGSGSKGSGSKGSGSKGSGSKGSGSGSGKYWGSGSGSSSGKGSHKGSCSGSGKGSNKSSGSGSGDRYYGSGSGSGNWNSSGSGKGSGTGDRYDIAAKDGSGYGSGNGSWGSSDYLSGGRSDGDLYKDHIVASSKFAGKTFDNGYTVFGRGNAAHGRIAMATLAAAAGIAIEGSMKDGAYAAHIIDAGDVNGDGFKDIVIAKGNDQNGTAADGKGWLVFGNDDSDPRTVNLDHITRGENGYDWDGAEATSEKAPAHLLGDVDNDGAMDVVAKTGTDGAYGLDFRVASEDNSWNVYEEGQGHVVWGGEGNDILIGSSGDDNLEGGDGDDVLIGNGGRDGFDGGAGDDVIAIGSDDFAYVQGGTGQDILRLDGMFDLDLGGLSDRIDNIETIDLTGHGDNDVTLDVSDVLDITEMSNNLTILGDSGDSVTADFSGHEVTSQDMGDFTVYTIDNGLAQLSISNDLTQNINSDMG